MSENLVRVLEELLAAAPGADAFHLRIAHDPAAGELDADGLEALFTDFVGDFDEAVRTIEEAWGEPAYRGSIDEDDFPGWSVALMMAFWRHDGALAYVSLRHDDDHEPMFIEIGALTDDEVSTLAYTKT